MNNRVITQPQIDELLKGRGLIRENNAELVSIIPFTDDGRWYLKLVYKYKGEMGEHMVVIPKASLPFAQGIIPHIYAPATSERPYMSCSDRMTLYVDACDLAIERGVTEHSYYFNIVTEYAPREMSLDEIEQELGYKVKIINKEKSNA